MDTDVTTLWADFHQELRKFILNKTKNPADTDDILQDVFIKIIRNIGKVTQAENLRLYLYGIVRNTINDYFRNKSQELNGYEISEGITEEESQSLNSTIADCCIKPFIDELPVKYREALLLTEFQNISQKKLSEKLNISYSGAKSRVQRGKEMLKGLILNCCSYQSDIYGNLIDPEYKDCNCS